MKKRDCPTVWASTENPDLKAYQDTGALLLPGLIPSQTIQDIHDRSLTLAKHRGPEVITEPNSPDTLRSIYNIAHIDRYFLDLVRSTPILTWAHAILGSKVYIHQSHINYKKAFVGKDYYWHQDYPFWKWEDGMPNPRAISVIIFIDEHRLDNGPLMYIEGSHQWEAYGNSWQRKNEVPEEGIRHHFEDVAYEKSGLLSPETLHFFLEQGEYKTLVGNPGDVFIMDGLLAHGSGPNFSPHDRRTLIYVLNSSENKLVNPTRPTHISSHDWDLAF